MNVDVTSNGPDSDDDGWSLGDALDDAGRVLEVIGGIALVASRSCSPSRWSPRSPPAISLARRRARDRALDAERAASSTPAGGSRGRGRAAQPS